MNAHHPLPFPVAGLGASAGGIEAIHTLLQHLKQPLQAAVVIATHLPADKKSRLSEVFSHYTTLPVQEIADSTPLESGVIYTVPSGHDLVIKDGVLRLVQPWHDLHHRIIDRFWDSLALDQGPNAVCVILSGSGSDGANGAVQVSKAGGLVLVQDPASAAHPGMPNSALEAGVADAVLSLENLAMKLMQLTPIKDQGKPENTHLIQKVLDILQQHTGQDLTGYRTSTIARRISKRKFLTGHTRLDSYLKELLNNPEERLLLFKSLFIGVTSFFRDAEAFAVLQDKVLPSLLANHAHDEPLRVWVAGCSTGEEAYSVAMLLDECLERAGLRCGAKIFATDIDQEAVNTARKGAYLHKKLHSVTPERLARHFRCTNREGIVLPRLREQIVFVHHNLLQDPPFLHMDLVLCRNLLIYLTQPLQEKALTLLSTALNPGGYLFLGSAESMNLAAPQLETIDKKWRIFRSRATADQPALRRALALRSVMALPEIPGTLESTRLLPPSAVAASALLRHFNPPAALVSLEFNVLHLNGDTQPFLTLSAGEPSLQLLKLVRKELRLHLRTTLKDVVSARQSKRASGVRLSTEPPRFVDLCVDPVLDDSGQLTALLVVFDDSTQDHTPSGATGLEHLTESGLILRYEDELQLAQGQLQKVIEEYEHLNEELRASNEELISMNEELQSSNEEMDASREELQSLNEELTVKVEELAQAHGFVENLLRSTNIPTVFLDKKLRVMRSTPPVTEIFHLAVSDQGRPLAQIKMRVHDDFLLADAAQVLGESTEIEREVQGKEGRSFIKRVFPYRNTLGEVEGVVFTYTEITRLKAAEKVLRLNNEELETLVADRTAQLSLARQDSELRAAEMAAIMEQTPAAVWITRDTEASSIIGNQASYRLLRMQPGTNVSKAVKDIPYTPSHNGRKLPLEELPMQRAARGEVVVGQEIDLVFEDGLVRTMLGNAAPLRNCLGEVSGAVGAFLDITEAKRASEEARRWQQVFERADFGLAISRVQDNTLLSVNPSFAHQRGYEPEELVGQPVRLVYPEEEHPTLAETIEAIDASGHGLFESWHRRKDGSAFPVLVEITVLKDEAGRPVTRVAYCLDITESKRTREEAARWQHVFEHAEFGIALSRVADNTLVSVNPAFARQRGYAGPEELLGQPVTELFPPQCRASLLKQLGSLEESGHGTFESIHQRKDGSTFPVLLDLTVLKDKHGKPVSRLAYALDVSERVHAEKELRESQAKLESALANMADAVFISDEKGNFVHINEAFATFHKFKDMEECPRIYAQYPNILEVFFENGDLAPVEQWAVPRALRGESAMNVEYGLRRKDTGEQWLANFNFSPIRDKDGAIVGSVVVGRDITERKRLEKERAQTLAEVQRQKSFLENLIKNAPIIIGAVEGPEHRFVLANPIYEALPPGPPRSIVGRTQAEVFPEVADEIISLFDSVYDTGEPVSLRDFSLLQGARQTWWDADYIPLRNTQGVVSQLLILGHEVTERHEASEILRESEERFRAFMSNSPTFAWMKDDQGRYVFISRSFGDSFGARLEDWQGKTDFELWPHHVAQILWDKDHAVLSSGQTLELVIEVPHPDGKLHTLQNYKFLITDAAGKRFVGGMGLDITERKRTEAELHDIHARLSLALDAANAGTWEWNLTTNTNTWSDEVFRLYDLDPATHPASYDSWLEAVHPEGREHVVSAIHEAALTQSMISVEYRVNTRNGRERWVYSRGQPQNDESGQLHRYLGIVVDITERKEAEKALRESETKLRTVADYTFDWEYWRTTEGPMVWVSPSCERVTGYSANEFLTDSKLISRIVHPEDQALYAQHLAETMDGTHRSSSLDFRIVHRNGRVTWISHHCVELVEPSGLSLGRRISNRDITHRKQAEEALLRAKDAAEVANKAKSEFLANMSHEIRTPLNGVLGMLHLLKEGASAEEQSSYSNMAYEAACRLLSLLNDILDFSRMETDHIALTNRPFQLQNIFDSVVNVFKLASMSKRLELTCNMAPDMPGHLMGDEARLRQILFNLVGNSIKFTRNGSIRVEAWSRPPAMNQDKTHLYLCVSDTGIGIPDDKMDHVFQRFTQTDSSYTRQYEGAGLGLAIVKRLVQLMGGDITVDSNLDQGTSIYLHLPLAPLPATADNAPLPISAVEEPGRPLRILIAEDEYISQMAIKVLLQRMGHEALCVNNGQEAVEIVRQRHFDCILMDIQMPEMNGVEATRLIRAITEPRGRSKVWIIALTAYALTGDRETFLAAGMDDYVSKPIQEEQLSAALERARVPGWATRANGPRNTPRLTRP